MKKTRIAALISSVVFTFAFTGCNSPGKTQTDETETFTSYFALSGSDIDEGNDIQELIAQKIGARCIETWRNTNKSSEEIIEDMILTKKYPDFIYGGIGQQRLLEADALVPLDEYWNEYENIKSFYSAKQWESIKNGGEHIYYIPPFNNVYMEDTSPDYYDEAFWIQEKVLEWDGFSDIKTLDQYFDLIERYLKANPVGSNGQPNIGYEILTDGYLYFCLENPPQFLDGYPNDGSCIVDSEKLTAIDYNTTPTAERWFRKLNEEYRKGIIDPGFAVLTSEQYYEKIRTGNVLGMADQYWNFSDAESMLPSDSKYVPLDLVIDEGITPHYRSQKTIDTSQGIGISVNCEDVEKAMKFLDNLLSPEILELRFWGIRGEDYEVDSEGIFYRTDEQREKQQDELYRKKHFCAYECFPYYSGMNQDGKNAYSPDNQPSEYLSGRSAAMKRCFEAYGVRTQAELINAVDENPPWYPMWSYTNTFTPDTDYGMAKINMDNVKHRNLPVVVMSEDFDEAWNTYIEEYNSKCDVSAYLNELTSEIRKRAGR